jgi:hypothetical protein
VKVEIAVIVVAIVVHDRKGSVESVESVESDLRESAGRQGHRVIGPHECREIDHSDLRESVVLRHRQQRKILRHHQHHRQTMLVLARASKRRAKPCYWHHHVQSIAVSTEVV